MAGVDRKDISGYYHNRMTRFTYFSFWFFRYWFPQAAALAELVGESNRQ